MTWDLEKAMAHHRDLGAPQDQNALVGLLKELQTESGGAIPIEALGTISDSYGIKEGILLALIRRIPSLRLNKNHCLELCAGNSCCKHTDLASCAEELRKYEKFELKYVPCMRMCGKGPNIRWDGKLYHRATKELLRELITQSDRA